MKIAGKFPDFLNFCAEDRVRIVGGVRGIEDKHFAVGEVIAHFFEDYAIFAGDYDANRSVFDGIPIFDVFGEDEGAGLERQHGFPFDRENAVFAVFG